MPLSSPSCRTALIGTIASLMTALVSASPWDTFRDKNRLIVISLPTAASVSKVSAILAQGSAQIEERDLKIIDVSVSATQIPHASRLTAEQTAQWRKELRLDAGEARAVFILIGKDGGEKARQLDALDLTKWFALIDQMPMRRQEMKRQSAAAQ